MALDTLFKYYEKSKVGYSPIVDSWFLFGSPLPIVSILITYVILVKYVGPKYMENREPYDLRWTMRIFNVIQISANLYLISRGIMAPGYIADLLTFGCARGISEYNLFRGLYQNLLNKLKDCFDTVFFVLRKKQRQVSFLHVFHHFSMNLMLWLMLKYFPGKEIMVPGLVNSTIHVLMYSYYFLASFGNTFSFIFRWKKYLTIAQMCQFLIVMVNSVIGLQFSCGFNPVGVKIIFMEVTMNLILFVNFYRKTYGEKDRLVSMQKMIICNPLQSQLDDNQNVKEKTQ